MCRRSLLASLAGPPHRPGLARTAAAATMTTHMSAQLALLEGERVEGPAKPFRAADFLSSETGKAAVERLSGSKEAALVHVARVKADYTKVVVPCYNKNTGLLKCAGRARTRYHADACVADGLAVMPPTCGAPSLQCRTAWRTLCRKTTACWRTLTWTACSTLSRPTPTTSCPSCTARDAPLPPSGRGVSGV